MTHTTIYLSVIHGKDTLTLDGNLYLFKELFTTLNSTLRELPKPDLVTTAIQAEESKQEETNVAR